MTRLFDLDFQLLFDAVSLGISVFFLFLIMSYLLFNPARKLLRDRQEKIRQDIASAAQDKEESAKAKAEYEQRLPSINDAVNLRTDINRSGEPGKNRRNWNIRKSKSGFCSWA